MTSKNLYIKLLVESIKRKFGIAVLICLVWFFSFTVPAMFLWGERYEYLEWLANFERSFLTLASARNGWTIFCMIMMAVVCGIASFRYLNSKSRIDFYHSLPVKREMLFAVNYTAGILIVIIPYLFFLLSCVSIGIAGGITNMVLLVSTAATGFIFHLIFFILIYTTVVAAMMLTGNMVIGFLGSMTFFFYFPALITIIQTLFNNYFKTYYMVNENRYLFLMSKTSPIVAYIKMFTDVIDNPNPYIPWTSLAGAAISSMILLVICLLLYQKRPSEGASKALVFHLSKPIIRIMIVVLISLLMAMMFGEIRPDSAWMFFGLLCGAVISHCMMEAIYHFDVRKLFTNWQQLLICLVASTFIISIFRYDLFGYDRYLPKVQQVQSAAIYFDRIDNWVDYGSYSQYIIDNERGYLWDYTSADGYVFEHMDVTDIEPILEIAKAGIEWEKNGRNDEEYLLNTEAYKDIQGDFYYDINGYRAYVDVVVQYTFNSGRTVKRNYYLPVSIVSNAIERLDEDRDYKHGKFPLLAQSAEQTAAVVYEEGGEYDELSQLSSAQRDQLLTTYQQEFIELTMETRKNELPIGMIRFVTNDAQTAIQANKSLNQDDYYWKNVKEIEFYPIYPSFVKTIDLLTKANVSVGTLWLEYPISSIEVYKYNVQQSLDQYEYTTDVTDITDPDAIKTIMKRSVPEEYDSYNYFYIPEKLIHFDANYQFGISSHRASRVIEERDLPQTILDQQLK